MLAGPAIIGPLTHFVPLNLTFFLPVAFCVTAACTAGVLRSRPSASRMDGEPGLRGPMAELPERPQERRTA